jgi:hypothetical protein
MIKPKPTIVICTSASFYEQAFEAEAALQKLGYSVELPVTAYAMRDRGDFDTAKVKTWYDNASDYSKKTELILGHFDKIAAGHAVLVLNYDKHDTEHYIGGNVLMEMGLALYLHKPIFVLHELPTGMSYEEELHGMQPIILHGKLETITEHL